MILSDFRTIIRGSIPGLTIAKVDAVLLDKIINSMVTEIAAYVVAIKTNDTFNVTAETGTYDLSTILPSFLSPDKPGLWWNDGTQWKKVYPRTLKWLDTNRPNWRNLSSGNPKDFSIDGNVLTIVPTPNTTLANGFKFYYGKKPTPMTSDGHYPFSGSTTEYVYLSVFDWAIVNGVRWRLKPMLGQYRDEFNQDRQLYLDERERAFSVFKKRPDISSDAKMRGPRSR